ncbi:hypothetical protein CF327_g7006 [Tilletia walkeri]|nr:hypothetical protein CF327_g7006 [Tilletia walkeri]
MVQEVVAAVRNRAPRDRSEAFDVLLARLAAPVYLREVDSAVTDQWLHLPPSLGVVEGIKQDDAITLDLRKIKSHYEHKMPATMCLIGGMVQNKARERPKTSVGGLQVSQPDLPGPESEDEEGVRGVSEEVEDALSPKDVKIVTAVSAILSARSPRPNRFQMTVAVMCSLLRVPQLVMRFLNACGISLSARTAHRAMESVSSQSIFQARRLIETHPCRTVLLFDNVNIYVKHSLQRIITSNVSIALTSRTLFTLPSQCTPLQLDDVRRIAALDRNMMTMETITGDDRFMDDAAQWHVAAALIPILTITEDRRSKLKAALRRRLRKRTINRLDTEKTKIVPLKIMKENEGTVEGTKRVLEVTMESFKLDKDAPDPFLVAGDLLTVLNVFAARHAASWGKDTLDQLANVYAVAGPWHLLLNWVYGMFRTYGHCDAGTSLERMRKILGRGKTELDMKRPQFDEGWRLLYHV